MSTLDNSNKGQEISQRKTDAPLPEHPSFHSTLPLHKPIRIFSPRLANRAQAADIKGEIIEEEQL